MSKNKKFDNRLDIDQIAELFSLPKYMEDFYERNLDYILDSGTLAYDEAIKNGQTEKEAEQADLSAQEETETELFHEWHSAVISVAEYFFEQHRLDLVPIEKSEYPFKYRVVPKKSWRDSASEIVETINGVGYFHFSSIREFFYSGPYTPKEAVITHLHWIKDYAAVYGDESARTKFDRHFR